jgi:hypothetical protein
VDPSPAALARELQKLVGHGLTPTRQQSSPQLRSVAKVPSGLANGLGGHKSDTIKESIIAAILEGVNSIQSEHYVKHLHQKLSAKKIRFALEALLLHSDDSYAFARRDKVLKDLGLPTGDSRRDWWRRPGHGPEHELMLILAEALLSSPSVANTGVIQWEDATFYIGSFGSLLRSEHRMHFMAVKDGFEYLRVFNSPRPLWNLEDGIIKPAIDIHTNGVEAVYSDSVLGFHFQPMQKCESLTIAWDVLAYDHGDPKSSGWEHFGSFAYVSPVQRLTIELRAPIEWYGEYVSFYSCQPDEKIIEAEAQGHLEQVTITGDQKVAQYHFRDLKPGWSYGINWRILPA